MHAAQPRSRAARRRSRSSTRAPARCLERLVFNHRLAVMRACALVTAAARLARRDAADAQRELREDDPAQPPVHPELPGQPGRAARPGQRAAHRRREPERRHLRPDATSTRCKKINDEVFLTPGVDRAWMKSLWAPGVRWTEVTEEGFRGGPVMPDNYDGSPPRPSSCAPTSRAPASSAAWSATTSSRA